MQAILSNVLGNDVTPRSILEQRSLSSYFPKDTYYFYGYPAGEGTDFTNLVPPEVEELVAARPFCCAGEHVTVVCFDATSNQALPPHLRAALRLPVQLPQRTVILPESISPDLQGIARNEAIKAALQACVPPQGLVMAQPFTDKKSESLFQLAPQLSYYFNDKHNLTDFIDTTLTPQRQGEYADGVAFVRQVAELTAPCVIKVSASSSGDGVYLCNTAQDIETAALRLRDSQAPIIVEQYIETVKNYGIHFGVPADPAKPIDIIGVNEQLTTPAGGFLGGIIRSSTIPQELRVVADYLQHIALPMVRAKGWYGIGGIDVLLDKSGDVYFIDGNFRMTGMSAYHFMISNGAIRTPLISFSGSFEGSTEELIRTLAEPLHEDNRLQIIALSRHENTWRFNGALCYTKEHHLAGSITELLDRGVRSEGLEQVVSSDTI